ncbi:MAG: carboxypeptidase regulatory-like domain-containing protein [Bryobacteraceae bacterium]|nr:carboxypeptidase regulatory-like domain-containing protein [Bryobacteraceae bacterium]
MKLSTRRLVPAALIALLLLTRAVYPQGTAARLIGFVSDPSGAAVVGTTVAVRNVATNLERSAQTNETGDYTVANLPPGVYSVKIQHGGFKTFESSAELAVNQTARLDAQLSVGETAETVTVEASVPLVDSETAALGQVIGATQVRELPLNGRNFVQLGQLVPGATPGPPAATTVRTRQGGHSLTINGQRQDQNNWMLDGVDNNAQLFGMVVVVPSIESISEFKVQTSTYSAEFGRAAGAVVNVETKSGSNEFHGSAYEFLRNDNFDATEYFAPIAPETGRRAKPPLVFNQFGASLGGPISRDNTFFFVNYEGRRTRRSTATGSLVPTAAQRTGNYAGSGTIYDPLTYTPQSPVRQPFAGNQIPSNRIHPASKSILEYIPLPNTDDSARNFTTIATSTDDSDQVPVRVDQKLSDKQWLIGRFSYYNTDNVTNNAFPLDADILRNRHRSFAAQHTYSLTPTLINEFRAGMNRYHFLFLHETAGENFTDMLNLPSLAKGTIADGFPDVRISGLARLGGNAAVPLDREETTIQFTDSVSWIRGGHSLRVGGDARRYTANNFQPQWGRGRYTFSGVFTGPAGGRHTDGFADFLLGLPSAQNLSDVSRFNGQQPRNLRWSGFVQDDWRASSKLTLNLGLRFERDGAWKEKFNQVGSFDPATGQMVYAPDYEMPFALPYPNRQGDSNDLQAATNGFAPRVGLAWRPLRNASFVVRSGYGIFWAARTAENLLFSAAVPPFAIDDLQSSGSVIPEIQFGSTRLGDPQQLIPAVLSTSVVPLGAGRNPYTQQWSLTLEKQLGANIGASIGYVGNRTLRLQRSYNGNSARPGPGALQPRRRYPLFGALSFNDSDGSSNYHALQAKIEKRFSRGMNLLSTYTWSKAIDDHGGEAESAGGGIQDPDNRAAARGLAGFDLRHRFTLAAVYELPVPDVGNRAANLALRGWQVNAVANIQSGFPFTPLVGGDSVNAGAGAVHPNVSGSSNGNLPDGERSIERWFDTRAFTAPAQYNFGNAGRNILIGPGTQLIDLGLARNFAIHEEHRLQFRFEMFNALNHPNFGFPGSTLGTANFGVIRTAGRPREIQMALRYSF